MILANLSCRCSTRVQSRTRKKSVFGVFILMSIRRRIRAAGIRLDVPPRIVSESCYLFATAIIVKLYDESRVLETVAIFSARVPLLTRCLRSYRIQTILRIRMCIYVSRLDCEFSFEYAFHGIERGKVSLVETI